MEWSRDRRNYEEAAAVAAAGDDRTTATSESMYQAFEAGRHLVVKHASLMQTLSFNRLRTCVGIPPDASPDISYLLP